MSLNTHALVGRQVLLSWAAFISNLDKIPSYTWLVLLSVGEQPEIPLLGWIPRHFPPHMVA